MKVLFVYSLQKSITQKKPLLGQEGIYFGISSIASVLKERGHSCELLVLDRRYGQKNIRIFSDKICSFSPQVVAFTAVYSEFDFIYEIASKIKILHPELFLCAGGIHLTLNPDEKYLDVFDVFCELLHQFGRKTGFKVQFGTNLRIFPTLDPEFVFGNFKKANIKYVTIGLESGSNRIRKEILNRNYSNEDVLRTTETARRYGVDIALFNMVGLPTETEKEFLETVEMNQKICPSFHATSIFFPYPGTELHDMCRQMNLLPDRIDTQDERQIATLHLPGFSKKQIQKGFDSFHYLVYKEKKDKSRIKECIYFSMQYLGHNFYANLKINIIRLLYKLRIKELTRFNLFSIFQRSK